MSSSDRVAVADSDSRPLRSPKMLAIGASSRVVPLGMPAWPRRKLSSHLISGCSMVTWRKMKTMPINSASRIIAFSAGLVSKARTSTEKLTPATPATPTKNSAIRVR